MDNIKLDITPQRRDPCNPYVMVRITETEFDGLYETDIGFERGTIFSQLDLPFLGGSAVIE